MDTKDKDYIEGQFSDGKAFHITTGELNFEKGKYYIYDQITNSFVLPPMEGGSTVGNAEIKTLVIDGNSQPLLVGALIENYSSLNIEKKGFIVSTSADNMSISDNSIYY